MDGTRAKGQKKGKVADGDEDAAESAAVKGAEMEEFKAEIKGMESTIFNWKGETEKKMETIENKIEEQDQKLEPAWSTR